MPKKGNKKNSKLPLYFDKFSFINSEPFWKGISFENWTDRNQILNLSPKGVLRESYQIFDGGDKILTKQEIGHASQYKCYT